LSISYTKIPKKSQKSIREKNNLGYDDNMHIIHDTYKSILARNCKNPQKVSEKNLDSIYDGIMQ
jgi:hypothetical protein